MILDKYSFYARILPAFAASVPALVVYYFFLRVSLSGLWDFFSGIRFVGDISITLLALLVFSVPVRYLSKTLFEELLFGKRGEYFPTTEFLLHTSDEFSTAMRRTLIEKIYKDFGIALLSEKEASEHPGEARKRIAEAVAQIRKKVGKSPLVHKHNIEYGMTRNLMGAALISLLFCILAIVVMTLIHANVVALFVIIAIGVFDSMALIFHKNLLVHHAERYAHVLLAEYLVEKK